MSVSEPGKIITPWAESGLKNPIPPAANPATGRAGFDQGFSAINMTAKEAGGIPPFGQDFNGIFYEVTNILRYMQAGGQPTFSSALATAIGGYPKGAMVLGSDGLTLWQSKVDGNSTNPNTDPSDWGTFDIGLKADLAAPGGAGLVGFQQSGTGAVARTAESKLREIVSIKDFGAKGDGVTDDTAAKNAMISALGYLVIPEGVFMVDRVACDGVVVGIFGTNRLKSILKSLPGSHTHTVEVSNDGGAVIRNITIDQNESTQPAGHGVRSGGCSILDIANTTIQNCAGYGVGLQGGTSKGVKIDNVLINNVGLDGVDVKDYNLNNEVVQINNLTVRNYGNRGTAQVAVDIRGIVNLTNLVAISDNNPNNRGFRFRSASAQGRVGSGTASNIYFKGTGAGSFALQISQNVSDYSIHGVEAEGSGFLAQFEQGSAGYVSGLVGRNLVIEGCTIFSDGLTIDGLIIEGATRGFDIEPTAKNNRITNFKLSGITGANFCRVQSGAENNQLVNGIVEVGKSTGNVPATTKTIIQNVTNFKTLYKGISNDILVDSVGTKTFVFTHGLDVAVAPDLSSIRTQVVASTSGGQNAVLGPVVINSVTSTQIEIVIKVITASPTVGAAIKVAIEASKYNGHP